VPFPGKFLQGFLKTRSSKLQFVLPIWYDTNMESLKLKIFDKNLINYEALLSFIQGYMLIAIYSYINNLCVL